ncbi:hypothetical protein [Sphingobacterium detergens]|uniref:hypothetical protein n=1 Tax=Sphingobacterium detergens TaxID=1145106 RepID=UPI003AAD079F
MSFVAVSAGVAAVSAGYSIYSGEKQKSEAKKLAASNKKVDYEVPGQVRTATQLAERNYLNGMSGMERANQNISSGSANAFAQAKDVSTSSNDLLDSISRIQQLDQIGRNELALQGMDYKLKAADAYQMALMREAEFEDKKYQLNEYEPYMNKANAASAMYGAGQVNTANGINGITNAMMGLGNNMINKRAIDIYGTPNGQLAVGGSSNRNSFTVLPGAELGIVGNNPSPFRPAGVNLNTANSLNSATEAAAAMLRNYKF